MVGSGTVLQRRRVLLFLARNTYRARAFLQAARALDVDVTVASDHRASLGKLVPGASLTVFFDQPDRSLARVLEAARSTPFAAVLAAEDEGVILAARAAQALGLRHAEPEAVEAARDKARMRRALDDAGLPGPRWLEVAAHESPDRAAARVPYPCVLKPRSLSASRGVIRADEPVAFQEALGTVRDIVAAAEGRDEPVLVEAFMPGREMALEGVLTRGRLTPLAYVDKPDPMDGPYFEETLLVTPSRHPPAVLERARDHVSRAAAALGLTEGAVHAEFRVEGGRVRLLELAPRSIGGRCSRILAYEGGTSLEAVLLAAALDRDRIPAPTPGARGVMMLPIPGRGVLEGVDGVGRARMVPGVEDLEITHPLRQEIVPLPHGHRYLGFLFARGGTAEQVETTLRTAHGFLDVRVTASAPAAAAGPS